jgi:mono/diheme cytochrome c family protein
MRAHFFLIVSTISLLFACSNQAAKVERESAERSMMEAFDNQFDSSGVLQFDRSNGERVFYMKCASCHGDNGMRLQFSREGAPVGLGASARSNPRHFWQTLYFGDSERKMPAFGRKYAFQDLVDATGYAMHLQ